MTPAQLQDYVGSAYARRQRVDRIMRVTLVVSAALALLPLFSVLLFVMWRGVPGLSFAFFSQLPRPVGESGGGMANALLGTCVLVSIASVLGVLWGGAAGIYLSEYGSGKTGSVIRFTVDMLASVPSIVIGLFVYSFLVVPMGGFSAIAGGVALGIIMIPTVARHTEEMLRLVPVHIREAGLALGLPRWKVLLLIVVRGSMNGIVTGVMLSVARVAGETAPLLFTALNNGYWQTSLTGPIASLPVQVYAYAISPFAEWNSQAWSGAAVLVGLVFVVNLLARMFFSDPGMDRG